MLIDSQKVIQGVAYLEEDIVSKDPTKKDEFLDAHGLLLELQEEMGELTNKKVSHVGVGFAHNTSKVKVVEFLSQKPIHISGISQQEDGSIDVKGLALDPTNFGVYALRIVASSNMKKEIAVVGPAAISFDKEKQEFSLTMKTQGVENLFYCQEDVKFLEVYCSKRQVDKIKYGADAEQNEKINVQHLELTFRTPLEYVPDPRTVIEDEFDQQRHERDLQERIKRQ